MVMKDKEIFSTVKPELIIGQLFQSRDTMHIVHHQTTSYAEHEAAGAYYEGIVDLIDELVESYFGTIGKKVNYKIPASEYVSPTPFLSQFRDYMKKHRPVFGGENTHIQNIIDEIIALITKTLYVLTLS